MPSQEQQRRQCSERIMSEDYGDFILEYLFQGPVESRPDTFCSQKVDDRFLSFYAPKKLWEPLNYNTVPYAMVPKLFTLQDSSSMTAAGITQVRQSALGLTGRGTLLGVIDSGIDYLNPMFRWPDGSTKIAAIWDQTINDGPLPEWMAYGSEYRQEQINEALRSEAPYSIVPSRDFDGHGTFMAGIAAGTEQPDDDFIGAAPGAALAVVKLKPAKQYLRDFFAIQPESEAYQENDIMLAAAYLMHLGIRLRMPLVILCGLGTNWGSHTGNSPLARTLAAIAERPRVSVVVPVGNENGLGHHFQGKIGEAGGSIDVELRVAPEERGFQMELWSLVPDRFTVSILSPGGDYVPQIPLRLGQSQTVKFPLENTTVDVSYRFLEVRSNSHLVVMRFLTPSPGVWTVRVLSAEYLTGEFHMWLPCQGFIREETAFLSPSPDTTLTVPASTENLLGIAAYNHSSGSIYIRSGRGYTRIGAIKPDLAAPGVDIYGPGLNGEYVRRSGTSMAAAHTAGAAACLLEWGVELGNQPWLNNDAIRALLIQGATRRPNLAYPNREWGYGTLNLYGIFTTL